MLPWATSPPMRKARPGEARPAAMSEGVTKNATLSWRAASVRPVAPPTSSRARTTSIRRCFLRSHISVSRCRGSGALGRITARRGLASGDQGTGGARLARRPERGAELGELALRHPRRAPALREQPGHHDDGEAERRPHVGRVAPHRQEVRHVVPKASDGQEPARPYLKPLPHGSKMAEQRTWASARRCGGPPPRGDAAAGGGGGGGGGRGKLGGGVGIGAGCPAGSPGYVAEGPALPRLSATRSTLSSCSARSARRTRRPSSASPRDRPASGATGSSNALPARAGRPWRRSSTRPRSPRSRAATPATTDGPTTPALGSTGPAGLPTRWSWWRH